MVMKMPTELRRGMDKHRIPLCTFEPVAFVSTGLMPVHPPVTGTTKNPDPPFSHHVHTLSLPLIEHDIKIQKQIQLKRRIWNMMKVPF